MGRNKMRKSREISDEERERTKIGERLRDAAFNGRLADVKNLIAVYADEPFIMNAKDSRIISPLFGRTPLVCAIQGGHRDVVHTLLQVRSVDYQLKGMQHMYRPLTEAARMNDVDTVKELLAMPEVDTNALDFYLCSPLMIVAESGNQALTEIFLKAGANRKLRNKHVENAAMLAKQAGHTAIANLLTGNVENKYSPRLFTDKEHDNNIPHQAELRLS